MIAPLASRSATSSPMPINSSTLSINTNASHSPPRSSFSPLPPPSSTNSDYFLRLSTKFVHFDPVTKGTSVFFDDIQCQVFVVRENGSAGVRVHSPIASRNFEFAFENKGTILSIKFSPDFRVLAVQRSNKSVEFLNAVEGGQLDLVEYSQVCRARSAKILGFCWVSASEIVLITDSQGLESYSIRPEKKSLRSLKNYSMSVNWFLFTPPYLLLSSGQACNVLHTFLLRNSGNYQRFPKFEVDMGAQHNAQNLGTQPPKLLERDVVLAPIYGSLYVLVIKQVSKLNAGAEVVMYQVKNDGSVRITDVLLLECNGRFAINILDNLIVVHHQQSKMSKIFDLKLNTRGDTVKYHFPVSSYSIEPYHIKLNNVSIPYELYSSNWAVFLPSIIVDAKLGCLWQLELKTDSLANLMPDRVRRTEFLLLRDMESKPVLIKHLAAYIHTPHDYPACVKAFELLNHKLKQFSSSKSDELSRRSVYLEQVEVFRFLLLPLSASLELPHRNIVAVLVEYLRSLLAVGIEPQYYVQELIINTMVQFKMYYLLRHFVENGVFGDSKQFACLLLSLEGLFPPAMQMALDMLKRLGNSVEEQVEILLAKCEVFSAIRLLQSAGIIQHEAQLTPRKFLEPALTSGDTLLFYAVFRFFQMRNMRVRGSPKFLSEELCDDIVYTFDSMFPEDAGGHRDIVF